MNHLEKRREGLPHAPLLTSAHVTRRDVIKAGATVVAGMATPKSIAATRRAKRVAVIGGGIGGLCCAYELMERGHEVTVLEASRRTGGHVKTMHDPLPGGLYGDLGAEQFTKPGYAEFWRYVKKFDLTPMLWRRYDNVYQRINRQWVREEELTTRARLKARGLNSQELEYVERHGWDNLAFLYLDPYIAKIKDEYQPFGNGLDELDRVLLGDLLAKEGATETATNSCPLISGGRCGFRRRSSADQPPTRSDVSALFLIWVAAIFRLRGLRYGPTELYHLKGGNQTMTDAFAARLGDRVRRNWPVTHIEQRDSSVTVRFDAAGKKQELVADYAVLCISPMLLSTIKVTPEFAASKSFALNNVSMNTYSRVLLQTRTPFWKDDIPSINLRTGDRHMPGVCETAEDVPGKRRLLFGSGMAAQTPEATIAAFREFYPGKAKDTIEQAIVYQWWKEEPTCSGCERTPFPLGQLAAMWPHLIEPAGRIHFAGAAYDNLWRGMDAATRSAVRAARRIDEA